MGATPLDEWVFIVSNIINFILLCHVMERRPGADLSVSQGRISVSIIIILVLTVLQQYTEMSSITAARTAKIVCHIHTLWNNRPGLWTNECLKVAYIGIDLYLS